MVIVPVLISLSGQLQQVEQWPLYSRAQQWSDLVELECILSVWLCHDETYNPVIELNTDHFIPVF